MAQTQATLEEEEEILEGCRKIKGISIMIRTTFSLAVAAGIMALAQLALAQDTSRPLSLSDAVNTAASNNPLLRETAEKINQSTVQVPLLRASLFPNISIIDKATELKDASGSSSALFGATPYNSYNTDLKLTQTLFTYGSLTALDSAKKDLQVSKINTEIAARDLASQVITAYFQVVLNMRTLDTLKRQLTILKESLATSQQRAKTGRGQVLDVLQTQTQIALLISNIATAENSVQTASASLASLLGDSHEHVFRIKDSLEAPGLEKVDHEVDLKNFRLPELERNSIALTQIDDQKKVARGQNLPVLSLTGDYIFQSYAQSTLYNDTSSSWSVGLALTIPLSSGFSSIYQQQVLDSQKLQLQFDRLNIENQTNLQQVTSRKNLETAEASITQSKEALRLAIASSDEARRMYRFSTIDFLQLLTVEQAYVTAESSYYNYKYNYIVALVNYFVASGQSTSRLIELLERANR